MNINKKIYNNKIEEDSKFYLNEIHFLEQKNEKLSEDLFLSQKENKNLENQIDTINLNLKYKDNIIQKLNEKLKNFSDEYNRQITSLGNNNNKSQFHIQQLFIENDKLVKKNNELNTGIKILNEKVKESLVMFNNKNENFKKIIQNYQSKLKEYKTKIILLKKRIDELLSRNNNNQYFMRKDNSAKFKHNNMHYLIPNKGSYSQDKLNLAYGSTNLF